MISESDCDNPLMRGILCLLNFRDLGGVTVTSGFAAFPRFPSLSSSKSQWYPSDRFSVTLCRTEEFSCECWAEDCLVCSKAVFRNELLKDSGFGGLGGGDALSQDVFGPMECEAIVFGIRGCTFGGLLAYAFDKLICIEMCVFSFAKRIGDDGSRSGKGGGGERDDDLLL